MNCAWGRQTSAVVGASKSRADRILRIRRFHVPCCGIKLPGRFLVKSCCCDGPRSTLRSHQESFFPRKTDTHSHAGMQDFKTYNQVNRTDVGLLRQQTLRRHAELAVALKLHLLVAVRARVWQNHQNQLAPLLVPLRYRHVGLRHERRRRLVPVAIQNSRRGFHLKASPHTHTKSTRAYSKAHSANCRVLAIHEETPTNKLSSIKSSSHQDAHAKQLESYTFAGGTRARDTMSIIWSAELMSVKHLPNCVREPLRGRLTQVGTYVQAALLHYSLEVAQEGVERPLGPVARVGHTILPSHPTEPSQIAHPETNKQISETQSHIPWARFGFKSRVSASPKARTQPGGNRDYREVSRLRHATG